ncbi:putative FPR3-prolyl cis-trans isomerase [Drechmeria coniospora]|uniref:FK506-binding protein n=1 Tax=Drechmeria coniospora TaxID=98403 RepID=A0A151GEP3_DRECN|nr:putative FPR3-prolyl cis-trans isomerase [Drechmeria coniospora]KYK55564.1 putative FPR3-prolyl cis-trans isomerase [Drechmeria coniospora]
MSAFPGPVYGLEVPPGEILIPAGMEFPASFRITMAALDPTEEPEADEEGNIPNVPRSTLRLVKRAFPGLDDDSDDEIDDEYMRAMLAASDDDDEDDDDEPNGGPSDAKKKKQSLAIKKLLEAAQEEEEEEDEEMEDAKPNGVKKGKGKAKAKADEEDDEEDSDEDSDDDSEEGADLENFVVCTLDTERNYQQTLDITVNHGEKVFFVVTGTHTVYLTGNYVMDDDEDSEDDEDYDFDPEELEDALGSDVSDDESDELDDIRIEEVDSEEEAPKLVETKKGKNKRAAEDAAENLDDMIKADDAKLSKKQQKKLKNNKGEAVAAEDGKKDSKKVQFAKNLEQGPTGSEKAKQPAKASTGVKVVQGVTIDDRTIGNGRTVKSGDTVGVRYIGKLANGQQFDANKKGKPFSFKVGKGQVIKGWDVGVVGMAIGGERRLTIPANLGYGSRGMPGIPANSQLIFDVKVLEIK